MTSRSLDSVPSLVSRRSVLLCGAALLLSAPGCLTDTSSGEYLDVGTVSSELPAGATVDTYSDDGAWCWFGDARAIHYQGTQDKTYIGWITGDGSIVVSSYNHENGEIAENVLHARFQQDDHANPSVFIRNDGRIIVMYAAHFGQSISSVVSTNPEDISSFSNPVTFGALVTYPFPFYIDDAIYTFFRGGDDWHPYVSISNDNGQSWGPQHRFIEGGGQRPYTKYAQDSTGGIHVAFTHGHPRQERDNKIYYVYFKSGNFYRSDGTLIKNYSDSFDPINIDRGEAEVVYDASEGKGWIWDIAVDSSDNPVMVYAAFPSDTNHQYYYARWTGSSWSSHHVSEGGGWFPQTPPGSTEPEPNYSGGITLDHTDINKAFLSKPVNGVFEIFEYTTDDGGSNWSSEQITVDTPQGLLNVRPYVPLNRKAGSLDLLWMRGTYRHYENYDTGIMYLSQPAPPEGGTGSGGAAAGGSAGAAGSAGATATGGTGTATGGTGTATGGTGTATGGTGTATGGTGGAVGTGAQPTTSGGTPATSSGGTTTTGGSVGIGVPSTGGTSEPPGTMTSGTGAEPADAPSGSSSDSGCSCSVPGGPGQASGQGWYVLALAALAAGVRRSRSQRRGA